MIRFVSDRNSIERLEQLQNELRPKKARALDREAHEEGSLVWPLKTVSQPPSLGFLERESVERNIVAGIKAKLAGGDFLASGQRPDGFERIHVEPSEWQSFKINFRNWSVGFGSRVLMNVLIGAPEKINVDDRLHEFVSVVLAKCAPGEKIVKGTVEKLAMALEEYEITEKMFLRAWEKAVSDLPQDQADRWKKGGRR